MLILGIETTCDETAAAVVADGRTILSNVIASQALVHQPFGGVVPELASREHLRRLPRVVEQALQEARIGIRQVDRIAVAQGPGLIGALLVGINTAKGLALSLNRPLVGVNHVEAHLYAAMMGTSDPIPMPALGVVISGGHTALLKIEGQGRYQLISTTIDDAVGEAFDKVAALLGLPYPGGPEVEKLAREGDPSRYTFKAGVVKGKPLAFSFSGLKTSVLYAVKGVGSDKQSALAVPKEDLPHVAAAFQETALGDLVNKITLASHLYGCRSVVIGGGVSHNRRLRDLLLSSPLPIFWPPPGLALDNAAMIAGLAYHQAPYENLDLSAEPRLKPFWLSHNVT